MTDLERKQSQLNYNLRHEKVKLENDNNALLRENHELQAFKYHAEFHLSELAYEKIDRATEMHLLRERADV